MRTTINLDPDVLAAADSKRQVSGTTLSQAVNELARAGIAAGRKRSGGDQSPVELPTFHLDFRIDVNNIGEVLGAEDEAAWRDR